MVWRSLYTTDLQVIQLQCLGPSAQFRFRLIDRGGEKFLDLQEKVLHLLLTLPQPRELSLVTRCRLGRQQERSASQGDRQSTQGHRSRRESARAHSPAHVCRIRM